MCNRIIGIDPSGQSCGVVILDNGEIMGAFNWSNVEIFNLIAGYMLGNNFVIVIEDIKPYSLRLTPQVIDTCKFIGEAVYRFKCEAGAIVELVARNEVKKWVFDTFPDIAIPTIEKKISKKGYITKSTGEARKPSFVFVDDKIVTESMKCLYKIPLPKPGRGYDYGLKTHSWQALSVASFFKSNRLNSIKG